MNTVLGTLMTPTPEVESWTTATIVVVIAAAVGYLSLALAHESWVLIEWGEEKLPSRTWLIWPLMILLFLAGLAVVVSMVAAPFVIPRGIDGGLWLRILALLPIVVTSGIGAYRLGDGLLGNRAWFIVLVPTALVVLGLLWDGFSRWVASIPTSVELVLLLGVVGAVALFAYTARSNR